MAAKKEGHTWSKSRTPLSSSVSSVPFTNKQNNNEPLFSHSLCVFFAYTAISSGAETGLARQLWTLKTCWSLGPEEQWVTPRGYCFGLILPSNFLRKCYTLCTSIRSPQWEDRYTHHTYSSAFSDMTASISGVRTRWCKALENWQCGISCRKLISKLPEFTKLIPVCKTPAFERPN